MDNKRCSSPLYHSGNHKGFKHFVPGKRNEEIYIYTYHSITQETPQKYPKAFNWPRILLKLFMPKEVESRKHR